MGKRCHTKKEMITNRRFPTINKKIHNTKSEMIPIRKLHLMLVCMLAIVVYFIIIFYSCKVEDKLSEGMELIKLSTTNATKATVSATCDKWKSTRHAIVHMVCCA